MVTVAERYRHERAAGGPFERSVNLVEVFVNMFMNGHTMEQTSCVYVAGVGSRFLLTKTSVGSWSRLAAS